MASAPAARATPARSAPSPQELEALVAQETARQLFVNQCNEAFESGKKAHSDFEQTIQQLNSLSPVFDPRLGRSVMPQSLVEAALATGQAHEVLYALGKDSALADRVLSLPPLKQAAELTKLSLKLEGGGGGQCFCRRERAHGFPRPAAREAEGDWKRLRRPCVGPGEYGAV